MGNRGTLIGIMPPRFGWGNADMWIPAKPSRAGGGQDRGRGRFSSTGGWLGHLRAGHHSERGGSRFYGGGKAARERCTRRNTRNGFTVQMESLTNSVVGRFKATLYIVLAGGGAIAADRLAETWRTCLLARGDHAGKRVCDPVGAGGRAAGG